MTTLELVLIVVCCVQTFALGMARAALRRRSSIEATDAAIAKALNATVAALNASAARSEEKRR